MKKLISLFTLLFICFILFSCASGTAFVTGKKRPYVNPDRISIYTQSLQKIMKSLELFLLLVIQVLQIRAV